MKETLDKLSVVEIYLNEFISTQKEKLAPVKLPRLL
jgi:hypothetical protein